MSYGICIPLDFSDQKESNDCCDRDNCLNHNNSYSIITIAITKDHEVLERTKATYAVVYTQDLRSKHEDRSLFGYTSMSRLQQIKMANPNHRFTAQITVPTGQTIDQGFERLLQNTLSQIIDAFVVRICGGSICDPDNNEAILPWTGDKTESVFDLAYVVTNMATQASVTAFIFSHYKCINCGRSDSKSSLCMIDHQTRLKLFDQDGRFLRTNQPFDVIRGDRIDMSSTSVYVYDPHFLTGIIHILFTRNKKLKYAEFNIYYKAEDLSEFNDFLKFCKDSRIVCFIGRAISHCSTMVSIPETTSFGIRCHRQ